MNFCPECKNILEEYSPSESEILYLRCRTCDYQAPTKQYRIFQKVYGETDVSTINQSLICEDVTYPELKKMKCINAECKGKVKYIMDKDTMKLTYICCDCDVVWYNA